MTTKKKVYLASFLAPMLIMLVAWIIDGFFPFGAKSLMAVDFNGWRLATSTCIIT